MSSRKRPRIGGDGDGDDKSDREKKLEAENADLKRQLVLARRTGRPEADAKLTRLTARLREAQDKLKSTPAAADGLSAKEKAGYEKKIAARDDLIAKLGVTHADVLRQQTEAAAHIKKIEAQNSTLQKQLDDEKKARKDRAAAEDSKKLQDLRDKLDAATKARDSCFRERDFLRSTKAVKDDDEKYKALEAEMRRVRRERNTAIRERDALKNGGKTSRDDGPFATPPVDEEMKDNCEKEMQKLKDQHMAQITALQDNLNAVTKDRDRYKSERDRARARSRTSPLPTPPATPGSDKKLEAEVRRLKDENKKLQDAGGNDKWKPWKGGESLSAANDAFRDLSKSVSDWAGKLVDNLTTQDAIVAYAKANPDSLKNIRQFLKENKDLVPNRVYPVFARSIIGAVVMRYLQQRVFHQDDLYPKFEAFSWCFKLIQESMRANGKSEQAIQSYTGEAFWHVFRHGDFAASREEAARQVSINIANLLAFAGGGDANSAAFLGSIRRSVAGPALALHESLLAGSSRRFLVMHNPAARVEALLRASRDDAAVARLLGAYELQNLADGGRLVRWDDDEELAARFGLAARPPRADLSQNLEVVMTLCPALAYVEERGGDGSLGDALLVTPQQCVVSWVPDDGVDRFAGWIPSSLVRLLVFQPDQ